MASFCNKVTSHRWKITNFHQQYAANASTNRHISGSDFALTVQSSSSFALFFKFNPGLLGSTFGVALKEFDNKKPLEVDVRMWLENDAGQKFYMNSVQKKVFAKVGDEYMVQTSSTGTDYNFFYTVWSNNKTLFVCCETTELNLPAPVVNTRTSASELRQEFLQHHWSAYENEMHDAIVKVGSTEFKVFKTFFMIQSDVFSRMFNSRFKEGITGEVEVKDIDEDTMQNLIKWLYTGQMEDETKAEELFKVAGKYNIKLLKKTCTEILLSTLNKGNAFARFTLGVVHNSDQLKNASLDLIAQMSGADAMNFTMSREWFEVVRKNPKAADEVSDLVRKKFNTGES